MHATPDTVQSESQLLQLVWLKAVTLVLLQVFVVMQEVLVASFVQVESQVLQFPLLKTVTLAPWFEQVFSIQEDRSPATVQVFNHV